MAFLKNRKDRNTLQTRKENRNKGFTIDKAHDHT
jgi:hypothetical protein